MTIHTPPSWLQNGSHPAENDRLTTQALWATTGIISPSSLAVTASSPANMSINIAAGWAAVVGTIQPNMGTYVAYNDGTVNIAITTANPTNPRIDLVCLTVQDSYYTGSADDVILQVIAGTPASSPVAPSLPANSISLATVAVAAGALSITSGNITDTRVSVTTNLPIGDITGVTAGTGLSGGGTSGTVTLAIDSTVATLTGSQTLTNKDLTSGTNTFPSSLATLTGAETLTNKILTSPQINLGLNAQTGTSYTTVLADNGKLVTQANAASITTTIAPFGSVAYPVGAQINFTQFGAGQVTIQGGSGVTVVSTGATAATPKTRAQYSTATAICTSQDNWLVVGDIS
jgi:hypothetical protein